MSTVRMLIYPNGPVLATRYSRANNGGARGVAGPMRALALACLVACSSSGGEPPPSTPPVPTPDAAPAVDVTAVIARHWPDGCFTMRDGKGKLHTSHPQRCATPRRPYSTFKLANALIAVELGLLANADAELTWDKAAVPDQTDYLDAWRRPHTLRTGMAVSAVPYFRTLALQIGEERMKAGLDKLGYGNRDLAGGLSRFWLTRGGLRISADQQLAFVEHLAGGTLPMSPRSQEVVRDVVLLAKTEDGAAELYGKTGSGPIEDGKGGWLVWQVGWVERGSAIVPYAAWMEVKTGTFDEARAVREQRLRATLDELALFPTSRAARP